MIAVGMLHLNAHAAGPRTAVLQKNSNQADFTAALAAAGPKGVVLVKAGIHDVAGTVTINAPVRLIGEPGAVIRAGTSPAPNWVFFGGPPSVVTPTLHILGTEKVRVEGLRFTAAAGVANCAVVVENSNDVEILDNQIESFQSGILVQHGDQVVIRGNEVAIAPLWAAADPLAYAQYFGVTQGIEVINGRSAQIVGNQVTGGSFGIFGNDFGGQMLHNTVSGCAIGYILCHQLGLYQISGHTAAAEIASNHWQVENNHAEGNFGVGYLVIDGSHHNLLVNNTASNNCNPVSGLCRDMELVGTTDYYGIGFVMPASHDNVVVTASQQTLVIKDCGENNLIRGAFVAADPAADPCP